MQKRAIFLVLLVTTAILLVCGCNQTKIAEISNDTAIKDNIQSKLFQDATLKGRDVHVESQKGVVTLIGTVNSDLEKLAVEGLARGTTGVTQVVDQLSVSVSTVAQTPSPVTTTVLKPKPRQLKKVKPLSPIKASSDLESQWNSEPQPPPSAPPVPVANVVEPSVAQVAPVPAPQPPPPVVITVPSGTVVTVRTIDRIDSSVNRAGEEFAASLETPIVAGDKVVIQRGADARLRLVNVSSAGHVQGRSELQLELLSIAAHGTTYPVQTGTYQQQGSSRGKQTGATMGGATGLGALIGAVAGGGKGAAIGAGIGAAGGGVATAATKGQQVKIASETKLDFTLRSPLMVTIDSSGGSYDQRNRRN